MGAIASQITSLTIVYSIVYSDADQRKHQSSASLAFVQGIHRGTVNSPHKWPVTRKMFPFDDVIMCGNKTRSVASKTMVIHYFTLWLRNSFRAVTFSCGFWKRFVIFTSLVIVTQVQSGLYQVLNCVIWIRNKNRHLSITWLICQLNVAIVEKPCSACQDDIITWKCFLITGPLEWESTGEQWLTSQMASNAEAMDSPHKWTVMWSFYLILIVSLNKPVEQTVELSVISYILCLMWRHCMFMKRNRIDSATKGRLLLIWLW